MSKGRGKTLPGTIAAKRGLAAELLSLAAAAGVSDQELSDLVGNKPNTLRSWRNGRRPPHTSIPDLQAALAVVRERSGAKNGRPEDSLLVRPRPVPVSATSDPAPAPRSPRLDVRSLTREELYSLRDAVVAELDRRSLSEGR